MLIYNYVINYNYGVNVNWNVGHRNAKSETQTKLSCDEKVPNNKIIGCRHQLQLFSAYFWSSDHMAMHLSPTFHLGCFNSATGGLADTWSDEPAWLFDSSAAASAVFCDFRSSSVSSMTSYKFNIYIYIYIYIHTHYQPTPHMRGNTHKMNGCCFIFIHIHTPLMA